MRSYIIKELADLYKDIGDEEQHKFYVLKHIEILKVELEIEEKKFLESLKPKPEYSSGKKKSRKAKPVVVVEEA